ncbi:hypothetical protein SZN_17302 [Streptomyces zinciresistens K42]|uniref:Uncharacterized protein n=1 Tax=Streptomyces zinciresistens K42 TaxID=700597 RepID=G2GD83_9ACTN|nr:hypothetical protein [Streptomyces zinciresistens]EGX58544.1 hypothetical protein SZN_17302 [Streptomyces zinciresistens K42]
MTLLEPDTDGQLALEDVCVDLFDLAGDPLDAAVARLKAGVKPTAEDIALLAEAARTAQRAFKEIGAANDVLDDASDLGEDLTTALAETLRRRARAEVPALLGALRAQAARVERSEAVRTVAGRILGNGGPDEPAALDSVPALTADLLPRVPSVYDDEEEPGASLADLWERQERLERVQDRVREERVEHVAARLVALAERIVDRAFTDARFTRAALDEMDRAHALWCACLDEG